MRKNSWLRMGVQTSDQKSRNWVSAWDRGNDQVQQLMDMGFQREEVMNALRAAFGSTQAAGKETIPNLNPNPQSKSSIYILNPNPRACVLTTNYYCSSFSLEPVRSKHARFRRHWKEMKERIKNSWLRRKKGTRIELWSTWWLESRSPLRSDA